MCEHCGCLSLPELAELTLEHDLALGHIRSARGALAAGDDPAAQEACRVLAALLGPHTAVEEHALFPPIAREHPEHVAVLLAEHRVIDDALAAVAHGAERRNLLQVLDLLSEHIKKEQDGVFPAALTALTNEDWERVRAERARVSPGTAAA